MKLLLIISLLFIVSCKSPTATTCEVEATYVQFASYQGEFAHRFQNKSNIYFYYKEFNGTIGNKYNLCVDGNNVIEIL